jgi:hypothetical protein
LIRTRKAVIEVAVSLFWRGSMRGLAGVASVRCIPCRAGKDGDVDLNPTLAENARL